MKETRLNFGNGSICCALSGRAPFSPALPRALPWAGMLHAVGVPCKLSHYPNAALINPIISQYCEISRVDAQYYTHRLKLDFSEFLRFEREREYPAGGSQAVRIELGLGRKMDKVQRSRSGLGSNTGGIRGRGMARK